MAAHLASGDRSRSPFRRARRAFDRAPSYDEEAQPSEPSQRAMPKGSAQIHAHAAHKNIGQLIGVVREVRRPESRRLCAHFLKDDCMWGDKCRFSHSVEELRQDMPETETMTFNNLEAGLASKSISVPRQQLKFLMTEETRQALADASGISSVVWYPETAQVSISGTAQQIEEGEQLLKRVTTHCSWGVNEAKVSGLLRLHPCKAAKVRLSPMHQDLKPMTANLNGVNTRLTIGSGSTNDIVLKGASISRAHATLEFIPGKGALYIADTSTNGTFLNGIRLPAKGTGKVVVWHGDELLFPEPNMDRNNMEYGYMMNVELIV